MKHNQMTGALAIYDEESELCFYKITDHMFETALFAATHYWSTKRSEWVEMSEDVELPSFMTTRGDLRFRASESAPLLWACKLNGRFMTKWETADSERGFVDVWERDSLVRRHRLFGTIEFVRIEQS